MYIPNQYREHASIMADYYKAIAPQGEGNLNTSFSEAFDAIYGKTENIHYGQAKDFLSTLGDQELEILRRYHTIGEDVDLSTLNEEQAFNLLVHRNEQLDLNGDHRVETAKGAMFVTLPQEMPNDLKRGIVETIETMQNQGADYFKDISPILMHMSFRYNLPAMMENLKASHPDMWSGASVPAPDYGYGGLLEMQESMHNPALGASYSQESVVMFDRFMETLDSVLSANGTSPESMTSGTETASGDSQAESSDEKIASFFDRVRAAGGALAYMQQLNLEKIEKLIEEKRNELEKKLNVDNLEGDALLSAIQAIEEMLEDYKTALIEDMEKRSGSTRFDKDAFLKQLILSPELLVQDQELSSSEAEEVV